MMLLLSGSENYAYWKGALHLKLVVNSTPFLYGMWIMDWCPLQGKTYDVDYANPSVANLKQTLCLYSQRTKVLIEPHKNENYQMTLPFIYPTQWHKFSTSAADMGTLTLRPVVPITAASVTTSTPTYTLYAYFDDLELSGPTLVVQSEYANGPISRPATIVSAAAGKLSQVPVIGKFAKATEIGAKAVGEVASLFGMCKVPPIDNVQPVSSQVAFGMGTGEIAHASERLTIDPKQEITRDRSRIGFDNDDHMNVAKIAQRKAIVSITNWTTSDVADTSLVLFGVNPSISPSTTGVYNSGFPSPAAYISHAFQYWRGDAVFTLRAIKSKFHTGRLLISFDPKTSVQPLADVPQAKSVVWDITKNDTITIRVKYLRDTAWLPTNKVISGSISERGGTSLSVLQYSTGYLNISVLNPLTAPLTTSDVGIVSELHWENFQLSRPLPVNDYYTPFVVQSEESNATIDLTDVSRMSTIDDSNYMGQEIISLRQLMNRSEYIKTVPLLNGIASTSVHYLTAYNPNIYPRMRGFTTSALTNDTIVNGIVTPASTFRYNCESNCIMSLMMTACVGYRGSVIHTYKPRSLEDVKYTMRGGLQYTSGSGGPAQNVRASTSVTAGSGDVNGYFYTMVTKGRKMIGNALSRHTVNDTLSMVIPYMNNEDFYTSTWLQPYSYAVPLVEIEVDYYSSVTNSGNVLLDIFVSAGADFDVFGYVNAPVMSYVTATPTYVSGF